MDKIKQIADQADMIINGYAFTREENRIRILNLNNPEKLYKYVSEIELSKVAENTVSYGEK